MVVEYVTGLKTAWEVAKSLKAATDAIDDAELKLQMADLISALADAKIEAAENTEEIAKLKKIIKTKKKLTYEAPFYWLIDEKGKEGPFCQHCNDKDNKTVRLQDFEKINGTVMFAKIATVQTANRVLVQLSRLIHHH